MKEKLENFLKDLSNNELAVFIAYRFEDFLPGSQKKITSEVIRRKLTPAKLAKIFREGLPTEKNETYNCPRCKSGRYFIEKENKYRHRKYHSYEVVVETYRCRLCGYNPSKGKPKHLFDAIKIWFFSPKKERLARPDEKIFHDIKESLFEF